MSLSLRDRAVGAFLGAAIGDALGMPVEGLSHVNVRTYYKGIKGLRADEKRGDLAAGQWTANTQRARAHARALAAAPTDSPDAVRQALDAEPEPDRRPDASGSAAAAAATALGVMARLRGLGGLALARWSERLLGPAFGAPEHAVASAAQAVALRAALSQPGAPDGPALLRAAADAAREAERLLGATDAVSARLDSLAPFLAETPLDLQERAAGTGTGADEAFPFAVAMVARAPHLPEATLLSAVNVGGDAASIGAVAGALLGALHGPDAFPADWRDGLEDAAGIRADAQALADALGRAG